MAHASLGQSLEERPSSFRARLAARQPDVASWLEEHLVGGTRDIAMELAARYFETTERWGETLPLLRQSRLNIELTQQVPTIDPEKRWMTELPVTISSGDRLAIGRLMTALVSVSEICA